MNSEKAKKWRKVEFEAEFRQRHIWLIRARNYFKTAALLPRILEGDYGGRRRRGLGDEDEERKKKEEEEEEEEGE